VGWKQLVLIRRVAGFSVWAVCPRTPAVGSHHTLSAASMQCSGLCDSVVSPFCAVCRRGRRVPYLGLFFTHAHRAQFGAMQQPWGAHLGSVLHALGLDEVEHKPGGHALHAHGGRQSPKSTNC